MTRVDPTPSTCVLRRPTVQDGAALWRLARDCGLDLNSPYAYLLIGRDFSATSRVLDDERGDVVGFVIGYRPPQRDDVLFVWQIAVDDRHRGRHLGRRMVEELIRESHTDGVRYLEATITDDNDASRRMFRAVAASSAVACSEEPLFGADLFPVEGAHPAELLMRIGPFDSPPASENARAP